MLADKLRAVLESRDEASVAGLYSPDALLDVNVVQWRFQRKGHEEIRAQFVGWYGSGPSQLLNVDEWPTPWGSVIQTEERWTYDGRPAYSRVLHVLFDEGGKVARHIFYCTGPWDAETEQRQKAEAPMYEP